MNVETQILELSIKVEYLTEIIAELKTHCKQHCREVNQSSNRITALEQQQQEDRRMFKEVNENQKEEKANRQKSEQEFQHKLDAQEQKLQPFLFLGNVINHTPGGLKTWMTASMIALLLCLSGIHMAARVLELDILLRNWLIEQTNIQELVSDEPKK